MTDVPAELPSPRDDDDDDVAWAMQTAQVQWQRGAYADAVTWLRRAADSALRIGATGRAWDLKLAASKLAAVIPQNPAAAPASAPPGPPPSSRPFGRATLSQFPPPASQYPPPASVPFPPSAPPGALPYPQSQRSPSSQPYARSTQPPASAPFPPSAPPGALPYPQSQRSPASAPFPPSSAPFPPSSPAPPFPLSRPPSLAPGAPYPESQRSPSSQPYARSTAPPPSGPAAASSYPPQSYPASSYPPPSLRPSSLPPPSAPVSQRPASFPPPLPVPAFPPSAAPTSATTGAFLQYSQDSRDSDPYDDGTDIIAMPGIPAPRLGSRPFSSEPILIEDADLEEDEELEPDLIQDAGFETIHPSDPDIEDEPASLLSELGPEDDDDDIEEERQSLLSDELEPDESDGAPVNQPAVSGGRGLLAERRAREALLAELEARSAAGVEVEADESEDEPTHKLRVDAVARRGTQKSPSARALAEQRRSDPPASLADELEPDNAADTLNDLDDGNAPAPATHRSQRPPGGIDWDDAPASDAAAPPPALSVPSSRPAAPAALSRVSTAPRPRSGAPASISPRATGLRSSVAPASAGESQGARAAAPAPAPAVGKLPVPRASASTRGAEAGSPRVSRATQSPTQTLPSAGTRSARSVSSEPSKTTSKNGVSSRQPSSAANGPTSGAAPSPPPPAPIAPLAEPVLKVAAEPAGRESFSELPTLPLIQGIVLDTVRGLQDLPEEAQLALAKSAQIETLNTEEELNGFAVALVLSGSVAIMPAIADVACAEAGVADVVFTEGHLADGVVLRVVASTDQTRVAFWNAATLQAQIADCPWVADDLQSIADRFQALAGASMGSLGDRLDATLRAMVTDRCDVIRLGPEETLLAVGQTVNGMYVVGAGHLELLDGTQVSARLNPGDFLFPTQVMAGGGAPHTARAGAAGALLLRAERMTAHELLVSVPPLLEILAS